MGELGTAAAPTLALQLRIEASGGRAVAAYAERAGDRSEIVMECLLEGPPQARVEVALRLLQLVDRRPGPRSGTTPAPVDELPAGGERYLAFEEAVEQVAGDAVLLRRWDRSTGSFRSRRASCATACTG